MKINLKRFPRAGVAFLAVFFASVAVGGQPTADPSSVVPQPYYGKIAQRVSVMLPAYHVLQQPLNDEISVKAWTNLITQYDFNHAVFLRSDLDRFESMKTQVDDAIKAGDVSFGYEVYRVFVARMTERVAFVTNLLARNEFDFTVKEDYLWQRKDAPWPATRAEQDELWRKRIKNELLTQILGRELDAEQAARDEAKEVKKQASAKHDAPAKETAAPATNTVAAAGTEKKDDRKANDSKSKDPEPDEKKLTPHENLIKRYRQYLTVLTEPDEETVLQRYLSAVAQAYDPHTDYMSPTRKEDFDMDMNLSLCGVGAVLSMDDGALKISEVMPGGPMARDGRIKKGDKIIGVGQGDGPVEDILYKPMKKSIKKIRGPKDTKVVLEIIPRTDPSGGTHKRISLIRDEIKLEDQAATGRVETVTLDGAKHLFGYVKLPGFYGTMDKRPSDPDYRSCSLDVAKYIAMFNSKNTDGMILDLRGNGGGSLREAVLLTALFVRPSPVVQIRETRNLYVLPTFPDQPTFAYRKPLIVMIDRASASASEIVAGALQDTGRAVIVGDRQTHGKGTVQTVLPIGSEKFGSMKITTARFYRINGSSTQVKGVASDLHLPSVLDGLDIGEDKLPNALPWSQIEPASYSPVWDMPERLDALRKASEARLEKRAAYKRHLRAVALFRESADRKVVPLERTARKRLMQEEREMRESVDEDAADDEESAEETAYASSESPKKGGKDDLILGETFNILSDIVRLTNGADVPAPPAPSVPAWLRALGGE